MRDGVTSQCTSNPVSIKLNWWRVEICTYYCLPASVADSEKLCRLVNEFGRVCESRKLRANVSKSKVMRCSGNGDGDRMHVRLNGEPLGKVDCFKYMGSQVAADGGCERDVVHRINEVFRALGALKSVLNNRGLGINVKCLYRSNCTNGVLWSRGMEYEKC